MIKSRLDHKREKDLDEARKAGIAPAATDSDGKDINPHIPQYMTKGLWYLNQEGVTTTLLHQKNWKTDDHDQNTWYDRGAKTVIATSYRVGACQNCGSLSHTPKFCLERPRKIGAKFNGKNFAADDKIENLKITKYEAKRDRWNGYDPSEYCKLFDRHEKIKEMRRDYISEKNSSTNNFIAKEYDEDRMGEDELLNFTKLEKRVNTVAGGSTGTVRNLRIREDTAKYLLNLDLDSAYYDPKSRSMREDPNPNRISNSNYRGDYNLKNTGKEYHEFIDLQLHQLNANQKSFNQIINAAPSQAESFLEYNKNMKERVGDIRLKEVISKYLNQVEG